MKKGKIIEQSISPSIKSPTEEDNPCLPSQKKVNNNNDDDDDDDDDRDWKKVHINPKVKVINENTIVVRGYDGTQK